MAVITAMMQKLQHVEKSFYGMYSLLMCFSVTMMFELKPIDCSRMVLLAEVSAKWINLDYLSLTSFDFCKKNQTVSLIAACLQDIRNYCSPHNCNSYFLLSIKMYAEYSQKER